MIYLDNAATTAIKPKCVTAALFNASVAPGVNAGRGAHSLSVRAINGMINTAEELSGLIGADDCSRIAFFQNATYALNFGIMGVIKPDDHVIITSMEHNSVLRPVFRRGNYSVVLANEWGYVNEAAVEKEILPNTKLIVCTHISNVCGSVQPIRKIGELARRRNILFMVDGAQSIGLSEINVENDNIDLLAFSGHKGLMGPQGTGALYVRDGLDIVPLIVGGTGSMSDSVVQPTFMPDALQSGTMNTPAIIALGEGVKFVRKHGAKNIGEYERSLSVKFIQNLKNINNVVVYGSESNNRNGTVAFNILGIDPAIIEEKLDRSYGIIVRSGYHCSPLAHKTIGTFDTGCVRASFGFFNRPDDCAKITDAIYQLSKQ